MAVRNRAEPAFEMSLVLKMATRCGDGEDDDEGEMG